MDEPIQTQATSSRLPIIGFVVVALLGIGVGVGVGGQQFAKEDTIDMYEPTVVERSIIPFQNIQIVRKIRGSQPIEVSIAIGDNPRVSIVGERGVDRMIRTDIVSGRLVVTVDGDPRTHIPTRLNIAAPHLGHLTIDGRFQVRITGVVRESTVRLEASSGAHVAARHLGARHLHVAVRRGAQIVLGGQTNLLRATATGGTLNASHLKSIVAKVSSFDDGRIEVTARDQLEAVARGSSSIVAHGAPQQVLRDIDASSSYKAL